MYKLCVGGWRVRPSSWVRPWIPMQRRDTLWVSEECITSVCICVCGCRNPAHTYIYINMFCHIFKNVLLDRGFTICSIGMTSFRIASVWVYIECVTKACCGLCVCVIIVFCGMYLCLHPQHVPELTKHTLCTPALLYVSWNLQMLYIRLKCWDWEKYSLVLWQFMYD